MRASEETREKWLKAFGSELPEAIKPFAEDEQDEHVTNGGMLARPDYLAVDVPLSTVEKLKFYAKTANDREIEKQMRKRRDGRGIPRQRNLR